MAGLGKTLPKIDFSRPNKPKVDKLLRTPTSDQVGALPNMILADKINLNNLDDSQS